MSESPKPILPPRRAYQGEVSGRMRVVLGVSLLLAVVMVVGVAVDWREIQPVITPSDPPPASAPATTPANPPPGAG